MGTVRSSVACWHGLYKQLHASIRFTLHLRDANVTYGNPGETVTKVP